MRSLGGELASTNFNLHRFDVVTNYPQIADRIRVLSLYSSFSLTRKYSSLTHAILLFLSVGVCVFMLLYESSWQWNVFYFAYFVALGIGMSQGSMRWLMLQHDKAHKLTKKKLRNFERLIGAMFSGIFALQAVPGVLAMKWFNDYTAGVRVFSLDWSARSFLHVEFSAWQAIIYTAFSWSGLALMLYCCVFRSHGDHLVCTD